MGERKVLCLTCDICLREVFATDGKLPEHWVRIVGKVVCSDCVRLLIRAWPKKDALDVVNAGAVRRSAHPKDCRCLHCAKQRRALETGEDT